jgi:hypothetical protein
MEGIILLIIVGTIVSIIASALKKKPKSSEGQNAPPRPTMTDIQRAFMMAAGMPENEQDQPPPATPYSRPASAPYAPPVAPFDPPVAPYAQVESTYSAPAVAQTPAELSARTATQLDNPYTSVQLSSYFMEEDDDVPAPRVSSVSRQTGENAPQIALFEDQRDIVKALIYAEILPRRSGAQRLR